MGSNVLLAYLSGIPAYQFKHLILELIEQSLEDQEKVSITHENDEIIIRIRKE